MSTLSAPGQRFAKTIARIDSANSEDPHSEAWDGETYPKELLYGQRMSVWLNALNPNASEVLRLAARSQHIRRWEIPRNDYPMDRAGYHRWRTTLYAFHGERAGELMRHEGYGDEDIAVVKSLHSKKHLKRDADAQTLEDAASLVFLEFHFDDFIAREDMDEAKLIPIVQKTWAKMSEAGHQAALGLDFSDPARVIIDKALA